MRTRINIIQQRYGTPAGANVGTKRAAMRFLRLMAVTARTEEARAAYLFFIDGERRLSHEHGGNKK